ncbi:MAG: glycosyltransferase [Cyanobacteriota bacterium]
MTYSIQKIEYLIDQQKFNLIINILNHEQEKNDLSYYFLAKCYLLQENYLLAYENIQKAVNISPYGFYKNDIFSVLLNELSTCGKIETNRQKIIIDSYDKFSTHARAIYPFADCITLSELEKLNYLKADYFIIPNWLSPSHPIYEKIEELNIPVISMIVDRIIHAEEHIKPNLIYADLIVCMENYAVELYKKQGFENVIYIPCAGSVGYDPYIYPPIKTEKKYDLVFLGNIKSNYTNYIYNNRKKILDKLEELQNKYNILIKSTPSYNEYVTLTSEARICLDSTIDSKALNYRVFQAMGMGVLCFSEDDNDMVKELYTDKKDLVLYNTDNLEILINYYLNNQEESNKIAKNGQIKTTQNYTHYHFIKQVIDEANKMDLKKSQKKNLSQNTISMYKGIMYYYKKDYIKAISYFEKIINNNNNEKNNNIFVQKLCLYEENKSQELEFEINNIFKNNENNVLIAFNYYIFLFFIKKEPDKNLIANIKSKLESKQFDYTGLIFLPKNQPDFELFYKLNHGEIIFEHGINSEIFINNFYLLLLKIIETFR